MASGLAITHCSPSMQVVVFSSSHGLLTLAAKRRGMVVVMPSMTNSSRVRSEKFDVANHVVGGQYIVEQHERS